LFCGVEALPDWGPRRPLGTYVLLELAETEARLLLTLDKDFWQIAVQRRVPIERSGVILFRVHPATPENLEALIQARALNFRLRFLGKV